MIRRILVMVAACALFSGACIALAGKAKEGYPMMAAAGQMSQEEVAACLSQSGLHVERFAGEVPFRHTLRLEAEEYRNGRLLGKPLAGAVLTGNAGLHRLLLLGQKTPEGLKLSAAYLGPGSGGYDLAEAKRLLPAGSSSPLRWQRARDSALAPGRRVELCRLYGTNGQMVIVFVTLQRQ